MIAYCPLRKKHEGNCSFRNSDQIVPLCRIVSSDCIQRKRPDTIINFLKGLAGYAAFFTSGTITVASRYDFNDKGLPVFM